MRKLLAVLMLFIYTLGVSGVGVASYFCCGRLAAVHIGYAFSALPGHGSTDGMQGCCGNTTHFFKIHDAQQQSVNDIRFNTPLMQASLASCAVEGLLFFLQSSRTLSFSALHSPPLLTGAIPLYIQLSVFRI